MSDSKKNISNNRVSGHRKFLTKKRPRAKPHNNNHHGTIRIVNAGNITRSKSDSNIRRTIPVRENRFKVAQPNHKLSTIYSTRPQYGYRPHIHPNIRPERMRFLRHPRNSKKMINDMKNQKPGRNVQNKNIHSNFISKRSPIKHQRNRKTFNKQKNTIVTVVTVPNNNKIQLSNISEVATTDIDKHKNTPIIVNKKQSTNTLKSDKQIKSPIIVNKNKRKIMLPMNSKALQGVEAGTHIKITTKQGDILEGEVFCSIPQIPPICVMHRYNAHPRGTKNIYVISINEIKFCEKYESVNDRRSLELNKIDEKSMQMRIERNMIERARKMRTLNSNISIVIQQLFDYLCRTSSIDLEWNENNSIVNIAYGLAIHSPYTKVSMIDQNISSSTHYTWIDKQLQLFWNSKKNIPQIISNTNGNGNDINIYQQSWIQPQFHQQTQIQSPTTNTSQLLQFQNAMNTQNTIVNKAIVSNNKPLNNNNFMHKNKNVNIQTSNVSVIRGRGSSNRGRGREYMIDHVPPRRQNFGHHYHVRGRNRGRGRGRRGKGRTYGKGRGHNISRSNTNISKSAIV